MKFAKVSVKNTGTVWLTGTVLVCLVFTYLFYDYILMPQIAKKEQLNNQLQQEKSRVAIAEQFDKAHPDKEGYVKELDAEVLRLNKLLPDRENMGETVEFLENTAKTAHVVFGALTTEKGVYRNGWTESRMAFKVLGSYNDLLEFDRQLDKGPRFMAVQGVEFHDRVVLDQELLGREDVQQIVEKELGKTNMLVQPIVDRGLLKKESLIVMNVYLMVATQGRLPDAANAPAKAVHAPQPVPPKS